MLSLARSATPLTICTASTYTQQTVFVSYYIQKLDCVAHNKFTHVCRGVYTI